MANTPNGAAPRRATRPARGAKKRRRHPWVRRTLMTLAIGLVALLLAVSIGGLVYYNNTKLPDANKDFQTNTTFIYYRDGSTRIGSLSIQNRQTILYSKMPQNIKDAVIAAENRTFWTDNGISPKGIARAAWTIARGGDLQGGSTITQQYVKVMYLNQNRTLSRKLEELVLSVKIARQVPKQKILADYLNTVYFGRGAYGIEAAARAFFNTDASKLSLEQSAVLAAVLNNPSLYDPAVDEGNVPRLRARYHYVLDGMLEMGKISQSQHDKAAKELPKFPKIPTRSTFGGAKGFLMNMAINELHSLGYDDSQIQGGGLQVVTTFDQKLEDAAVKAVQDNTKVAADKSGQKASELHGALASVQVGTGELLAAYGGPDFVKNSRNWATTPRPAASTFKAWATVAALRNGLNLGTVLNGNTFTPPGDNTPIRNEDHLNYGPVTLKKAVTDSINTAFVDAVSKIKDGPAKVIQAANDAGVPKAAGWAENDRIPLGIAEVSPVSNATGYATLGNGGKYVPTHVIKQVKDRTGATLFEAKVQGKQTIENDVTRDVTFALQSVVNQGTGTRVSSLGYDIAGKTGTNGVGNVINSAWFTAYTRQISTAVMYVAGDSGTGDLDPYRRPGDSAFFGGTYPAMTWAEYMKVAMEGLPHLKFDPPAKLNGYQSPTPTPVAPSTTQAPTTSTTTTTQTPSATTATSTSTPPPTTTSTTTTSTTTTSTTTTSTKTTSSTTTSTTTSTKSAPGRTKTSSTSTTTATATTAPALVSTSPSP